jgi:hypothetical protein
MCTVLLPPGVNPIVDNNNNNNNKFRNYQHNQLFELTTEEMGGHVARTGATKKKPTGRTRHRWESHIKLHRKTRMVSQCGLDSAGPMGCAEHRNDPSSSLKGGLFGDKLSEYRLLKDDEFLVT